MRYLLLQHIEFPLGQIQLIKFVMCFCFLYGENVNICSKLSIS